MRSILEQTIKMHIFFLYFYKLVMPFLLAYSIKHYIFTLTNQFYGIVIIKLSSWSPFIGRFPVFYITQKIDGSLFYFITTRSFYYLCLFFGIGRRGQARRWKLRTGEKQEFYYLAMHVMRDFINKVMTHS